MDDGLALAHIERTIGHIDEYRDTAKKVDGLPYEDAKAARIRKKLAEQRDTIQQELVVSREIASAAGRPELRKTLRSIDQPFADRWHAARESLVDLQGSVSKAAEIDAIVGASGPSLAASELHPVVWDAVRNLWSDGHHGPAIHAASVALEAMLQVVLNKRDASGVDLAKAFALDPPSPSWPRLRIQGLEEGSETYKSAHVGAGNLLRGGFGYVRNLASHAGGLDIDEPEALEQLAVLSTIARIVSRSGVISALPDMTTSKETGQTDG